MPDKRFVRNKEEKIRLIYSAFADLVKKEGYDKLSTRHIAEAANISVGTVYHYFPEGKHAIASGYLREVTQQIFVPDVYASIGEQNLTELFEYHIQQHLKAHRENVEIHRAIEQAILADNMVFERHKEEFVVNNRNVVKQLKERGLYQEVPEKLLVRSFMLLTNLIEAIIHRHLFVMPFFETDEELVEFLVNLCLFITEGWE